MANLNSVFGARLFNLPWSGSSAMGTPYLVPATDATALFVGDFVKLTGDSAIWTNGAIYPTVTQAAATDTVVGFVVGFEPHPNFINQIHRTASTLRLVYVIDNPAVLLEIQSTGTAVSGDIGQTADVVVAAGSTFTGLSGMQLDRTSLGNDKQLKIVGVSPRVGSELGAYTKLICKINKHAYTVTTGV